MGLTLSGSKQNEMQLLCSDPWHQELNWHLHKSMPHALVDILAKSSFLVPRTLQVKKQNHEKQQLVGHLGSGEATAGAWTGSWEAAAGSSCPQCQT